MPNENHPPGAENAGTGTLKSHQLGSTSIPRWVKRRPAHRITKADREALSLLYGPPESHDQEDDEVMPVNTGWRPSRGIEKERIGGQDA